MDGGAGIKKKRKIGLIPKLLVAIVVGVLLGSYAPEAANRVVITASTLFGSLLKFIIPLMILAFVTMGIADLTQGAGKLLGMTAAISYASTLIAGGGAYLVASNLFPMFMGASALSAIGDPETGMLQPFFTVALAPVIDVMAAIVLAFILGLSISAMRARHNGTGDALHDVFSDFSNAINSTLHKAIIPLLPLYICGTFVNMTVSGATFTILGVLWKVFLTVVVLHLIYVTLMFFVSGSVSGKNPFVLMKNQIPGYLSAIGTQSSAATIPVNLACAEKDGVSAQIRNFVIPLCSNIHMPGSMITITCCVTAVLLMYGMPHSIGTIIPFIMTLGIAMMASPGAPGGSIMSALPFLPLVGVASDSAVASLLIALYITQDSFGTACNVSGDNAISVAVDNFYRKHIAFGAAETVDNAGAVGIIKETGVKSAARGDIAVNRGAAADIDAAANGVVAADKGVVARGDAVYRDTAEKGDSGAHSDADDSGDWADTDELFHFMDEIAKIENLSPPAAVSQDVGSDAGRVVPDAPSTFLGDASDVGSDAGRDAPDAPSTLPDVSPDADTDAPAAPSIFSDAV